MSVDVWYDIAWYSHIYSQQYGFCLELGIYILIFGNFNREKNITTNHHVFCGGVVQLQTNSRTPILEMYCEPNKIMWLTIPAQRIGDDQVCQPVVCLISGEMWQTLIDMAGETNSEWIWCTKTKKWRRTCAQIWSVQWMMHLSAGWATNKNSSKSLGTFTLQNPTSQFTSSGKYTSNI